MSLGRPGRHHLCDLRRDRRPLSSARRSPTRPPSTPPRRAVSSTRARVHIHIHARTARRRAVGRGRGLRRDPRRRSSPRSGRRRSSTSRPGTVGVSVADRVAYLEAGRPEVAALNMGSLNYAKYSRSRKEFVFEFVFANPFDEIIELLEAMRRLGIKPEHECFDLGHVASLEPLVDMGLLDAPLHADFIMGVLGGVPATARNLAAMADNLPVVGTIAPLGRDRHRPLAVDDDRRRAVARRLGPRRARGQLLPARRDDGALQRRADREGAAAWRRTAGRRPATVDRGARAARHPRCPATERPVRCPK